VKTRGLEVALRGGKREGAGLPFRAPVGYINVKLILGRRRFTGSIATMTKDVTALRAVRSRRFTPKSAAAGRPTGTKTAAAALLLDVALRFVSKPGHHGGTTSVRLRASGVTPAMVHYYFKTRDSWGRV